MHINSICFQQKSYISAQISYNLHLELHSNSAYFSAPLSSKDKCAGLAGRPDFDCNPGLVAHKQITKTIQFYSSFADRGLCEVIIFQVCRIKLPEMELLLFLLSCFHHLTLANLDFTDLLKIVKAVKSS